MRFLFVFVASSVAVLGGLFPVHADLYAHEDLKVYADFRVRLEQDFDSRDAAGNDRDDRLRARIRARIGLSYGKADRWSLGLRLRSGSELSHQSPHITVVDFDGNDTGDADFDLDRWFLAGKSGGVSAWIGRNSFPFWQQDELFWDADATLPGLAVSWSPRSKGGVAIHAGYFTLPVGMRATSGNLGGLQIRWSHAGWTAAIGHFDFDAEPSDPDAGQLLNGNGLRDYRIGQVSLQWVSDVGGRRFSVGADYLHNSEDYSDETDGHAVIVRYGSLNARGEWLIGWSYARIETFAVNASYAQDDWVRWGSATETRSSDFRGHELRYGRALSDSAHVMARLYLVEALTTVEDGNRFRVDLNRRF